jgi:hypothetical protein
VDQTAFSAGFERGAALAAPQKFFIFVIPRGLQSAGNLLFDSFSACSVVPKGAAKKTGFSPDGRRNGIGQTTRSYLLLAYCFLLLLYLIASDAENESGGFCANY